MKEPQNRQRSNPGNDDAAEANRQRVLQMMDGEGQIGPGDGFLHNEVPDCFGG